MKHPEEDVRTAVLDMAPHGCPSCKRAIEHAGRHYKSVKDIRVDIAEKQITVLYVPTEADVVSKIREAVSKFGYETRIVSDNATFPDS